MVQFPKKRARHKKIEYKRRICIADVDKSYSGSSSNNGGSEIPITQSSQRNR